MKYISHRAIICTLTLLIIIITVLFTFLRSSDVPEYITAPVRKGDIENSVLATGRIDAIERVNVKGTGIRAIKITESETGRPCD